MLEHVVLMKHPFISVIFPVETKTVYLAQALKQYAQQTYKQFEVIISSTRPVLVQYPFVRTVVNSQRSHDVSSKRNVALAEASGSLIVFNDDDVYVPATYLEHVVSVFRDPSVVSAGGPLLTPPDDSFMQKASGAVWESYLGSFGAGLYRSRISKRQVVYDYPAANLIVRADVFRTIGGFVPHLFPGEDTKLCLDMVNSYKKGVVYDPRLVAYHHRKPLFKKHLVQVGRYGTQRGWFAITYPETSFRISYFLPSLLFLYVCSLPVLLFLVPSWYQVILFPGVVYTALLVAQSVVLSISKGWAIGCVGAFGIAATHLYYGYCFLRSFTGKIVDRLGWFMKLVNKLE